MQDQTNEIPSELIYIILKAMNIDVGEFMYNLLNDKPKEIMIYAKIYDLYSALEKQL